MAAIGDFFKTIWGALLSFNFTSDLLDIIFVTFIIYEAIKFIRGSRSFHLIKGIAFIALLYILVKLTGMESSEFLLSSLIENALILLVVLFAPEIRNILERFGRRSITDFSFLSFRNDGAYQEAVTDLVNDFCKAAGEMSETKTGALVVFERETPLNDVIKSGTVLDARSSAELFNGIFFKNSALHDGAVVVKNAKIYSAGCILPLTQNNSISSDLGTRHRAAIGMSEQSDAVVVVVSEETGYISVAINGQLQRDVQTGKLREILLSNLIAEDTKKEKSNKKIRGEKRDKKQK
ncbi:MAG: TIGR00159 family protein [Ruminococcaceae bacterium]|nr:TIGR00159 family protein [Oscillospiraceae bacterium]